MKTKRKNNKTLKKITKVYGRSINKDKARS